MVVRLCWFLFLLGFMLNAVYYRKIRCPLCAFFSNNEPLINQARSQDFMNGEAEPWQLGVLEFWLSWTLLSSFLGIKYEFKNHLRDYYINIDYIYTSTTFKTKQFTTHLHLPYTDEVLFTIYEDKTIHFMAFKGTL
jgi:hypothetical protein